MIPHHPSPCRRSGFTLVELLVVILILSILVALLVPAIWKAVVTANEARVTGEINSMGQSLASFRTKFSDLPPSRIILREDGFYNIANGAALSTITWFPA